MQALRSTFYLILTLSTSAFAQDMRTVAEPRLPKICTVIKAALTAQDGQLPDVAEEHLDTERLQDAIDHCTPGQALELAKDGAQDAFLSGLLQVRPTVTLLVDAGVTLFASRSPRVFDRAQRTCGVVNQQRDGCKTLLLAANAPHGAVMGAGVIDGQGGRTLLHSSTTWWDLAEQARARGSQQAPLQTAQVTVNPESPALPKSGTRRMAVVAQDGSGNFRTVQEAVDSLTAQGGSITVRPGVYHEVVRVMKPHVRLIGSGAKPSDVVIVYGESAYTTGSTFKSATVFVTASDFFAENLTMQNDYSLHNARKSQGDQALAISVSGDRAVFEKVRFLGGQDTLYAAGRGCKSEMGPCEPARQYFHNCYIEGHVDFIFGDALAVFDHCEIHAIAYPTALLTAQSKHYPGQASGYVFNHCTITSDPATGQIYLGRPWRDFAEVVFLNSVMDAKVNPIGWSEWHPGETERLKTATYAEYQSTGLGASPGTREEYSRQLTAAEATRYATNVFLAGSDHWHPTR